MLHRLPHIPNPAAYVGLYVYDFGTHASVGYTAAEIQVLRASAEFANGEAYQIYRVHSDGTIELRGVRDALLEMREAMVFLRTDPDAATRDYSFLREAARHKPTPAEIEVTLLRSYKLDPPNAMALSYSAAVSHLVSGWLDGVGFHGSELFLVGVDAVNRLDDPSSVRIASSQLLAAFHREDRSSADVLRFTDQRLQRVYEPAISVE